MRDLALVTFSTLFVLFSLFSLISAERTRDYAARASAIEKRAVSDIGLRLELAP
ncbi:MAG TPA: hypothetical protein VNN77_12345 [candidate division Zixibacteria bacterium]|nr:hypothetical protein [candidate division Zixibacteria bacterium]